MTVATIKKTNVGVTHVSLANPCACMGVRAIVNVCAFRLTYSLWLHVSYPLAILLALY